VSSAERATSGKGSVGAGRALDQRAGTRAPRRVEKSADAFRTISEVADELEVPQHVLRFWETKFTQIRPLKRGGGRRYYRPEDIDLLRAIRGLLYDQGYTIKGVQKLIRDGGLRLGAEAATGAVDPGSVPTEPGGAVAHAVETAQEIMELPLFRSGSLDDSQLKEVRAVAAELMALRDRLRRALDLKPETSE